MTMHKLRTLKAERHCSRAKPASSSGVRETKGANHLDTPETDAGTIFSGLCVANGDSRSSWRRRSVLMRYEQARLPRCRGVAVVVGRLMRRGAGWCQDGADGETARKRREGGTAARDLKGQGPGLVNVLWVNM